MSDETYPLPGEPVYQEAIRRLQNSDPVDADAVLNPLIEVLIGNTHFVRLLVEAIAKENAADHAAIRRETAEEIGAAVAAIPTPDVSGQIAVHDGDASAHAALFQAKQDVFDVGVGLRMAANEARTVLSAIAPNKILTQAEYDALPDAEKQADAVYMTTGVGDGSGGKDEIFFVEFTAGEDWHDPASNVCDKTLLEIFNALLEIFNAIESNKLVVARLRLLTEDGRIYTFCTATASCARGEDVSEVDFQFHTAGWFGGDGSVLYNEYGVQINV